ncbi:hypothetical protein Tco_0039567 [Tanacetum coccineum]
MALSIADQIALDDALVAPADRLKIGKCNLRLSSDVTSKEATLQVVYDVLKLTPFYKAFQVTADAPDLYAGILGFCLCSQSIASLGHSGDIRKLTDSPSLSSSNLVGYVQTRRTVDYAVFCGEDFSFQELRTKVSKKGSAMYYPRFTKLVVNYVMEKDPSIPRRNKVNWHYARDDPMFTTINVISRNEANRTIPPKTKGSKKKANTDAIPKRKPPTAPKEKKSGTGKQKTTELENIPEADLTEAEQLKIVIKRSRQETHSSQAKDDISWKSSDDDQDDEQDQDDDDAEKHDVHETTQEQEDDDDHDDDENDQEDDDANDDDKKAEDDDDEEQTESDDDGDDFVHPKLTTHDDDIIHEEDTDEDDSSISSSDDEDSDNEDEGTNVEGAKSDEEATYEEDQGNEAVKDTNTDLDGRDKVMTDVEDTHVTLTPVNPDGQQQSSSVSSGFVSNMLNPNQDTGVDDIFGQHTEATSLIDTHVTAIMEPSFTAQINRPPTPYPLDIQTQQPPIMTPATTTSSLLQNLPNFASLFGFDYRLKALEDNFSELRQTNQYAEALSSIPGTVDQYLANKMQEAVDVAVQLKYDRIREESTSANQQFLDSIDDGKSP